MRGEIARQRIVRNASSFDFTDSVAGILCMGWINGGPTNGDDWRFIREGYCVIFGIMTVLQAAGGQ